MKKNLYLIAVLLIFSCGTSDEVKIVDPNPGPYVFKKVTVQGSGGYHEFLLDTNMDGNGDLLEYNPDLSTQALKKGDTITIEFCAKCQDQVKNFYK